MFKWLQSRTVWTIILMAVIGAWQALEGVLPPETFVLINTLLGALAVHFRINTRVK